MSPTVSVLMPHFTTRPEWLERAVGSILGQDLEDLELLFADDQSPGSAWRDVLATFSKDRRLKIFQASRNGGPYRLKNLLMEHATGKFVAFQDADDWSTPDRLGVQVEAAKSLRAGVIGSSFRYVDADGQTLSEKKMVRHVNLWVRLRKAFVLLHSTCLVEAALLRRLGGFDGHAFVGGDDDFLLRAVHVTRIRNLPNCLYAYRSHGHALTSAEETGRTSDVRSKYIEDLLDRDRSRWWGRRLISRATPGSLQARPTDLSIRLEPVTL